MDFELAEKEMPEYPSIYTHINFMLAQKTRQFRAELEKRDRILAQIQKDLTDRQNDARNMGFLFGATARKDGE